MPFLTCYPTSEWMVIIKNNNSKECHTIVLQGKLAFYLQGFGVYFFPICLYPENNKSIIMKIKKNCRDIIHSQPYWQS